MLIVAFLSCLESIILYLTTSDALYNGTIKDKERKIYNIQRVAYIRPIPTRKTFFLYIYHCS